MDPDLQVDSAAQLAKQIAVVHGITNPVRHSQEYDILSATAAECVRGGPLLFDEVLACVQRTLPGAGVNAARLLPALREAKKSHHLEQLVDGTVLLGRNGAAELKAWTDWAEVSIAETRLQMQQLLTAAGMVVDAGEADVWLTALSRAIHASVRQSFAAYEGKINRSGVWLAPQVFDRDALLRVVDEWAGNSDESRPTLLRGLSLDAIDPLKSFGNDLVTHITTGYLLHAFVGHRDHLKDRSMAGMLRGDRAILDTGVLLALLGPDEQAMPLLHTIRAAISTGMEIILPDHYLEELSDVVERTEKANGPDLIDIQGLGYEAVGLLSSDEVVTSFLRARAKGRYGDWDAYRAAADEMGTTLVQLGVTVRPHFNDENDRVDDLVAAIEAELLRRGRTRGVTQIRRDAETMAMARRTRTKRA